MAFLLFGFASAAVSAVAAVAAAAFAPPAMAAGPFPLASGLLVLADVSAVGVPAQMIAIPASETSSGRGAGQGPASPPAAAPGAATAPPASAPQAARPSAPAAAATAAPAEAPPPPAAGQPAGGSSQPPAAPTLGTYPTWKFPSYDGSTTRYTPTKKNYARAGAEVVLLEVLPWAWGRYVANEPSAYISWDSLQRNWHAGFGWDRDKFSTNQWSQPYQGSLFFNAGRTNGLSFWESTLAAAVGSTIWEYGMSNELPATNDLVNATLGGASRGEVAFRLSRMLLDNKASGSSRLWREIGAAVLNPVGSFNRLLDGQLATDFENPPDRFPPVFFVFGDVGYLQNPSGSAREGQAMARLGLRYGDPHESDVRTPFDTFDLEVEMAVPGGVLVPYAQVRGLLAGWEIDRSKRVHHVVAPGLRYEYFNTGAQAFGGQGIDLGSLSRWTLPKGLELRTELAATGWVLAAIQTDYEALDVQATGRSYDYGPGAGVRADVRLRREQVDLVTMGYSMGWFHTSNGISRNNRLQQLRVEGRVPVWRHVGAGAGWSWIERFTTYGTLPSVDSSGSSWRVFGTWNF